MYIGVWPEYHVAKLVAKAHSKHSRSPSQHRPVESATRSGDSWRSSTSAPTATSWISEVREGMGQVQFAKRVDILSGHEPSPRLRNFNIGPDQLPAACRSQSERRLAAVRTRLSSLQHPRRRASSSSPQQFVQQERQHQQSQPRLLQPPSPREEEYLRDGKSDHSLPHAVSDVRSPAQAVGRPPRMNRPSSRPGLWTPQARCTTGDSTCVSLPAIRGAAQADSCASRTCMGDPCCLPKPSDIPIEAAMPLLRQASEVSRPGGKHGTVPQISETTDGSSTGVHPEAQQQSARPSDAPATMPSQDEGAAFVLDPATEELIAWSQGLQLEDSFGPR
mmetsp:Transcript_95178/g.188563  ORF Transcript_95178/g.188563 Transcript_95178/m.188563 type:complete len:333 (+) Transcript_95178:144-1142(+)